MATPHKETQTAQHCRSRIALQRFTKLRMRAAALDQSGQTLIEFAITISVLLTALFTLMEICLALYTWSTITELACEGTRYAIVRGSTCVTAAASGAGASCTASASAINSYVASIGYPNIGGAAITVNTRFSADGTTFTTTGNNDPNDIVRVQVSYPFPIRLPFVPKNGINMSVRSEMTIIQ